MKSFSSGKNGPTGVSKTNCRSEKKLQDLWIFLRQLTGLEDMQAAKVCFISDFQLLGFMIELNIKKSSLGVEVERGIVIVICSKID